MPKILITGAAGFIGQILAKQLLSDSSNTLILTDVIPPPIPKGSKHPENATTIQADLYDSSATVVTPDIDAVYILHGIMSSGSEAHFDLGMRVNVDATRALVDTLRHICPGVRVIYASSGAVYGQPMPAVLTESVMPYPESSYGVEKMIGEYLINDYTRRGWINGFSLRFPTISVRPGKPTAAASSFLSGMVREPLAGVECVIPIKDRGWKHWLCSPRTLVYNLIHMLSVPKDSLPPHFRSVNVPGFQVSVQDMRDALEKVAGKEVLNLLKEEEEPETKRILLSWADCYDNTLALKLGMKQDKGFEQSIRDYIEDLEESNR